MKVITGRGLIWLCVIVLLLVCDGNKVYSNTSSSAAIFEDVEAALAMRSTDRSLVYLFSISHAKSILTLAMNSSLPVTEKDVFCFDLNQDTGDDVLLEIDSVALARSSSSFPFTFLLVSGVESLETEKEVGKLNFLHSVTDVRISLHYLFDIFFSFLMKRVVLYIYVYVGQFCLRELGCCSHLGPCCSRHSSNLCHGH